jgi:hypothetical protein
MDGTTNAVTLLALGAFHGINPGMGWLFAVALGLQERRRRAAWRALLPLALGHSLAVAAAVVVALTLGLVMSAEVLRWPVAVVLVALGASRPVRHRHPSWAAMRIRMGKLTLWSFLMASAHGAGLMVVPVFAGMTTSGPACHASATIGDALVATGVHSLGYVLVTAVIAIVVFEKLGVGILRRAWVNLDTVWAVALIATGVLTAVA